MKNLFVFALIAALLFSFPALAQNEQGFVRIGFKQKNGTKDYVTLSDRQYDRLENGEKVRLEDGVIAYIVDFDYPKTYCLSSLDGKCLRYFNLDFMSRAIMKREGLIEVLLIPPPTKKKGARISIAPIKSCDIRIGARTDAEGFDMTSEPQVQSTPLTRYLTDVPVKIDGVSVMTKEIVDVVLKDIRFTTKNFGGENSLIAPREPAVASKGFSVGSHLLSEDYSTPPPNTLMSTSSQADIPDMLGTSSGVHPADKMLYHEEPQSTAEYAQLDITDPRFLKPEQPFMSEAVMVIYAILLLLMIICLGLVILRQLRELPPARPVELKKEELRLRMEALQTQHDLSEALKRAENTEKITRTEATSARNEAEAAKSQAQTERLQKNPNGTEADADYEDNGDGFGISRH